MSRRVRLSIVFLCLVVLVPFVGSSAPPVDGPAIQVQPVNGVTVGPGRKLWVFVFPARGKGGPPQPATDPCLDGDQSGKAFLGFELPAGGLTFNITAGSIPSNISPDAITAIHNSFGTWQTAVGKTLFATNDTGGAGGPAADGNNTVGWVRIVPKNVLAATWVWTTTVNGVDTVTDADIFYNLFQPWGIFSACNAQDVFEVQNIGTHEVGHVIGLAHVKDAQAMATMYPSAPAGEVKKQTLTTGDRDGAIQLTNHL